MEVCSSNDGYLTDIEVLDLLRHKHDMNKKQAKANSEHVNNDLINRDNIESDVVNFLTSNMKNMSPVTKGKGKANSANSVHMTKVSKFVTEMDRLMKLDVENDGLEAVNITEVEIIQLCNHQPENEMELNLILDYTRCNEKHNDIILATVANCFSVNES